MKCAGCNGGNHTAWSKDCPARNKELGRAKAAKLALSRLFPVASMTQFITKSFNGQSTDSVRQTGVTQDENMRLSGASQGMEEALDAPKKRKLNPIGRPKGSINKTKTLSSSASANNSILNFNFTPNQTQIVPSTQIRLFPAQATPCAA
jgi:hypothetical protein